MRSRKYHETIYRNLDSSGTKGWKERNKRELPVQLQNELEKELKKAIIARQIIDKNNRKIHADDKKEVVGQCEAHLEQLAIKRCQ